MILTFAFMLGCSALFGIVTTMCFVRLAQARRDGSLMLRGGYRVDRLVTPRRFTGECIKLLVAGLVLAPLAIFFICLVGGMILNVLLWS